MDASTKSSRWMFCGASPMLSQRDSWRYGSSGCVEFIVGSFLVLKRSGLHAAVGNGGRYYAFCCQLRSWTACCHDPPRGRASSSGGHRAKPSTNKGCWFSRYRQGRYRFEPTRDLSPPKCHIYLRPVFRFGFAVSSQLTSGRRPHVISVRHLMGLGEKKSGWR